MQKIVAIVTMDAGMLLEWWHLFANDPQKFLHSFSNLVSQKHRAFVKIWCQNSKGNIENYWDLILLMTKVSAKWFIKKFSMNLEYGWNGLLYSYFHRSGIQYIWLKIMWIMMMPTPNLVSFLNSLHICLLSFTVVWSFHQSFGETTQNLLGSGLSLDKFGCWAGQLGRPSSGYHQMTNLTTELVILDLLQRKVN